MSYTMVKIEGDNEYFSDKKAGSRKWLKKMRNRLIRRTPVDRQVEDKRYDLWEW